MKKVGYLGPRGTFTEAAARKYFAGREVDLVCFRSLEDIVAAVEGGSLDEGVVPLENSTEGAVGQILDMVARAREVKFCGEVVLKISHNLMVRPGTEIKKISRVLSHPQALAQCREFLAREMPGVCTEDTASTSQAAALVAASPESWAAIGTDLAAVEHGLEIVGAGIQDCCRNATRFIVLGRLDAGYAQSSRTSLVLAVRDRPGALYEILREFAQREINLTRIESRPSKKKLGRYLFFIDLEGHRSEARVRSAIEAVAGRAAYLKVIGSYPGDTSLSRRKPPRRGRKPSAIEELRAEIDLVDARIVELVAVRSGLAEKIGHLKGDASAVRDPAREEEVVRRVRDAAAREGVDPEMIESIYRSIISNSVEAQTEALRRAVAR